MAEAQTRHFGVVRYAEDEVIHFPAGLPAFEHLKRFVVVGSAATAPVIFLQSVEDAGVCLPAVPVRAICADYQLALTAEDLEALDATPGDVPGFECLAVVSIPERGESSANLLAPVVVNMARRRGVQAVRSDAAYSHRHPVRREGAACW